LEVVCGPAARPRLNLPSCLPRFSTPRRFCFTDTPLQIYEASDIKAEAKAYKVERNVDETRYRLGM
jgi:hypothetical protein|tara:strand:+ start:292 stop:489 length:198 start_codon:yes stop_codon:yes gene_type:complete